LKINKESSGVCPCCGLHAELVGHSAFSEYYCNACDHTFFSASCSVNASNYTESAKYQDYYVGASPNLWYHRIALNLIKQYFGAKVLDFGCFDGFFVRRMVDCDIDAWGCDWNHLAIARGREAFELGDRLQTSFDCSFDIVTALEVIEHFEDPRDFMELVSKLQRVDGLLVLSCPNRNAIYRPRTDEPPHHFSRFSTNSLKNLVEQYGYEVMQQETEISVYQLLRNYVGDQIRGERSDLEEKGASNQRGASYKFLRTSANVLSILMIPLLVPVDFFLKTLGVRYLSQVLIARRK
jgi:SAM-dependent methyltransferase